MTYAYDVAESVKYWALNNGVLTLTYHYTETPVSIPYRIAFDNQKTYVTAVFSSGNTKTFPMLSNSSIASIYIYPSSGSLLQLSRSIYYSSSSSNLLNEYIPSSGSSNTLT